VNRTTLEELNKRIGDIQHMTVRLGGRIQLTAYHTPDHPDIEKIPGEIEDIELELRKLSDRLKGSVFGQYDVVWYQYTEGDPEPRWRNARPSSYKLAKQRAEVLNNLKNSDEGRFVAVSLHDMEKEGVFDMSQEVYF
jgi:hypothetical protein